MGVYLELEDLQVNAMPFCSFVKVQPEAYSPLTILEHLFFATGNFGHLSQIACSMFCRGRVPTAHGTARARLQRPAGCLQVLPCPLHLSLNLHTAGRGCTCQDRTVQSISR